MDDAKNQLADKLKTSANILVTVSRNPSVDQLAACIGLTLLLNKQGKHAAAVFSGTVPSTLEFLQPEDTLEKTTDSLRDFIISLDKSKADKLRYKVEDNVVRIFITPYRTSISDADLEFTQGDFNVDLVIALGVHLQEDLDEAITAHGRILHDATLASINTSAEAGLGTINWLDQQSSSLCELVTELAQKIDSKLLDNQIATALLTGIVAETDRFSNDKTSSETMAASAALMAAGANQQLVASKLQEGLDISAPIQTTAVDDASAGDGAAGPTHDGVIEINHGDNDTAGSDSAEPPQSSGEDESMPPFELPTPEMGPEVPDELSATDELTSSNITSGSRLVTEPPSLGGMLTANTQVEGLDPAVDPLSLPSNRPPQMFDRSASATLPSTPSEPEPAEPAEPESVPEPAAPEPDSAPTTDFTPPPPAWVPPPAPAPAVDFIPTPVDPMPLPPPTPVDDAAARTLADLEASIKGSNPEAADATPLSDVPDTEHLDAARDEVSRALSDSSATPPAPQPIQALNAQPLGVDLHSAPATPPADAAAPPDAPAAEPPTIPPLEISEDGILTEKPLTISPTNLPPAANPPAVTPAPDTPQVIDPTAPPPVPPPIPFQFGTPPNKQ